MDDKKSSQEATQSLGFEVPTLAPKACDPTGKNCNSCNNKLFGHLEIGILDYLTASLGYYMGEGCPPILTLWLNGSRAIYSNVQYRSKWITFLSEFLVGMIMFYR
jgi:hypothetical protein